jgi:hypothetical protein
MNSIALSMLMLLTAAPAAPATDTGLSPLAEKYARKREALIQQYAARRRALAASPRFKASTEDERKAALDKLAAEAKAKDEDLIDDYDAELRRGRAAADADAAKLQRERQSYLDEQRTRASQDAARPSGRP